MLPWVLDKCNGHFSLFIVSFGSMAQTVNQENNGQTIMKITVGCSHKEYSFTMILKGVRVE